MSSTSSQTLSKASIGGSRQQIACKLLPLHSCLLVIQIMQMIGTTFHHLLDRQKHTCRPSRQHRSEGIQATAGQRFAGSSRTRPTQPSPGGFCGLRIKEQCVNVNCPGHQPVKNTLPIFTKTAKTTNTANQPRQKIPCGDRRRTTHSSRPPCSPLVMMMMMLLAFRQIPHMTKSHHGEYMSLIGEVGF